MKGKDLTGARFGKLLVLKYDGSYKYANKTRRHWVCQCDCGNIKILTSDMLLNVKSCGCVTIDRISNLNKTHGKSKTPEYKTWLKIKERCYNKNTERYPNYGGRGIKVCESWLNSFEAFLNDMGEKPDKSYSIDRIDVNKDYCKENCRWATNSEQMNNTTKSVVIVYKGISYTLKQWSEAFALNYKYIHKLYKTKGLTLEQILTKYEKI